MSTFEIGIEWSGDAVHLHVRGELDIAVAPRLVERVEAIRDSSARLALVDLSAVDFIDSSGVRALIGAQQVADDAEDFEVIVVCASKAVREVMDITGVDRILSLADTADAALRDRAG
jgi:anti-sigma B factor antagonist